jgi:DNA-binding NarL/FixJ family response regulator
MHESASKIESRPAINLLLAVENRVDGQLFEHALMRTRKGINVVSYDAAQHQLPNVLKSRQMDVALVTENLPDAPLHGFQLIKEMRSLSPETRAIMLLNVDNADLVVDAFRAGAKGVFCRSDCLTTLPKCIRAVHSGQVWANSRHLDRVMEAFASAAPLKPVSLKAKRLLTKREGDVVSLIVQGFNNRETGDKLGLTEHTVSNYLFRIYDKLGISTRVELVLYALKDG